VIAQICIALFGFTSAWLVYDHNPKRRKWAPLLSLLAQPAWYWSAISASQWGVVALSVVYTILHFRGFWKQWVAKPVPTVSFPDGSLPHSPALEFRNCSEAKIKAGGHEYGDCAICDGPHDKASCPQLR